jgi:succinate dehydrogenase/fumarate reductase flavoprotein subunit
VIILESAPSHLPGGNTGCCAGFMVVPSSVPEGLDYYRGLSFGTVRDELLIKTMAECLVAVPEWLAGFGIPIIVDARRIPGTFPALPGSTVDQILVKGGGFVAFRGLAEQVNKRGIKVYFEAPAHKLIQDPATVEVIGVVAVQERKEIRIRARKGVVLACGGYQKNARMFSDFNYPGVKVYNLGTPYNNGAGIWMAAEVGAMLWHMSNFELMNFAIKEPSDEFNCSASLAYVPMTGSYIYVNRYGQRFVEESRRFGHYKGDIEACKFDHKKAEFPNLPPFLIFDEVFRRKGPLVPENSLPPQKMSWFTVHNLYQWSADNSAEVDRGWIKKAETIAELAAELGIDAEGLSETVRKYNAYCQAGRDGEWNRDPASMTPIAEPPYYGTELCFNIINTHGGPVHNHAAQVIGTNGAPIRRLYAAGELGSFFGHLYQGGSNFPEALAFGRIAGRNAAAETSLPSNSAE